MPANSTNIYVYMGVFAAGPNIYFACSENRNCYLQKIETNKKV